MVLFHRGMKNTIWEGGLRGAGWLWSPLLMKSGYISDHMIHISDWLPTLLHAVQYNMTIDSLDGIDQWDVLSHNLPSKRTEILHNIDPLEESYAIRYNDMKLISDFRGNSEQYDGWYPPSTLAMTNETKSSHNQQLVFLKSQVSDNRKKTSQIVQSVVAMSSSLNDSKESKTQNFKKGKANINYPLNKTREEMPIRNITRESNSRPVDSAQVLPYDLSWILTRLGRRHRVTGHTFKHSPLVIDCGSRSVSMCSVDHPFDPVSLISLKIHASIIT